METECRLIFNRRLENCLCETPEKFKRIKIPKDTFGSTQGQKDKELFMSRITSLSRLLVPTAKPEMSFSQP
jgi:hypothetical protein